MNQVLHQLLSLEVTLKNNIATGGPIDRLVSEAQLKTVEIFKNKLSMSYNEQELLAQIRLVFGL